MVRLEGFVKVLLLLFRGRREGDLHAAEATNTALLAGGLSLHLFGDLDVDLEELADATVEADGLALVQITLAVGVGNALLSTGLDKTAKLVSTRRRCDDGLVGGVYRLYMSETMSISASAAAIFSADEGWGRPAPKRKDILVWVEWVVREGGCEKCMN